MNQKVNFYSGPSILPKEVLEQAQAAIENFENTGLSILEISHRTKEFVAVMEGSRALAKELMGLSDEYEVLYMQGGASSQFYMIPYNFLSAEKTGVYIDTGTWASGALEQAKLFGKVHVAASSKNENYNHIPKQFDIPDEAAYLHITTNNTIFGTQYHFTENPKKYFGIAYPLIADMSSDILSRKMDFNAFDLIYAGAQKNIGTSGATLVAVKKTFLAQQQQSLPAMVDYAVQAANQSMKNTPAVFPVYVSYLTLQWIKKNGLDKIEAQNKLKAKTLYDAIDASSLFKGTVAKEDRSQMNVCFVIGDAALEKKFSDYATENGIVGIEGHRSVGGFRASIYNAMPQSGVDTLVQLMREFESRVS
jgi:phosphoserine aminotransferase